MKKSWLKGSLAVFAALVLLSGCAKSTTQKTEVKAAPAKTVVATGSTATKESGAEVVAPAPKKVDLSKNIELKFNLSYGNKSRTMTYNQSTPLTLSNGDVVTAGMLKPMWSSLEKTLNTTFRDVSIQDAKANDMINTESTSGFSGANIYGGNSIASDIMAYGAQGKFVNLAELMKQGYMPNFKAFLDQNPNIRKSITAYDGGIYQIPYIAEVGNLARTVCVRQTWIEKLLDNPAAAYNTTEFKTFVKPIFTGKNARTGAYGGSVTPKPGVSITKKTTDNIIQIQNELPVKNGKTLAEALVSYIKRNYEYAHASELYLGEKAAYDMDEMVALFRVIKANGMYLTDGKSSEVWPFFTRQANYREDIFRYATWFNGFRVHGSDSYDARWSIDKDGALQYTYSAPEMYDMLSALSDWNAEGLLYSDFFDLSNKGNFRSKLYGTDSSTAPHYGFMTYDWIASTTSASLNKDVVVILPPVAPVNGVWQYYLDNSRVIKPDGWAISVAGSTPEQVERASAVFDYFFTEDGHIMQNYGLLEDIASREGYVGPDGKKYPQFNAWVLDTVAKTAKGDLSSFLRDWMGAQMAIGYQKEIGFEYQYTSESGFEGWKLLNGSTVNFPTYEGKGIKGDNPNYYRLTPPAFSLTDRQSEILKTQTSLKTEDVVEMMFNIIKFKTPGNAPSGAFVARDYDEYLNYFKSKGLDAFVNVNSAAYEIMQAEE